MKMDRICFATGSLGEAPVLLDILDSSMSKIDARKLLGYSAAQGLDELREMIVNLHQLLITKDNVLITSGGQQSLGIAFDYIAQHTEKILLQEPAYFGAVRLLKKSKMSVETFSGFSNLDSILRRTDAKAVYLTSNFQNPSGECLPDDAKAAIAGIAREKGILIVEDNPYDLLYYDNDPRSTLFRSSPENILYLGSFSKILAPGLRTGYIIGDEKSIKKLKALKIDEDLFTSTLSQQVCLYALQEKRYLDGLRKSNKERRDNLLKSFEKYFGQDEGISWSRPEGGIFIQLKFRHIDSEKLVRIASEKYNLVLESDAYSFFDGKGRNTMRINFVQNDKEAAEEGIRRLYECVKGMAD